MQERQKQGYRKTYTGVKLNTYLFLSFYFFPIYCFMLKQTLLESK